MNKQELCQCKPSLKSFLNFHLLPIQKPKKLLCNNCNSELTESRQTIYISNTVKIIFVGIYIFIFSSLDSFRNLKAFEKIIFIIITIYIASYIFEAIHWMYAKFDKN